MIALLLIGHAALQTDNVAATNSAADAYLARGVVPGFAIAISQRGRIVYNRGFGTVDASGTVRPTGNTLFRLGSISKPMTALMVMRLVEQGKVGLDDDVRKYVPSFPDKGTPITVRQVLSHTSGIRHYQKDKKDGGHFDRCVDALKVWQDDPLLFTPGEKYSYSTHAYTLLGAIVEQRTGLSYDRALGEFVRKKAGTPTPRVEDRRKDAKRHTSLFQKKGDKFVLAQPDDLSWKTSGGGLESTAPDLCRVGDAFLTGKIVSLDTLLKMTTTGQSKEGKTRYGLGLELGENMFAHGGTQLGAKSVWILFPRQGVVITMMSNYQDHPLPELALQVAKIWTGAP